MGSACTKDSTAGHGNNRRGRGKRGPQLDDFQTQKVVRSAANAVSSFERSLVSGGKLESFVYGHPVAGRPELDPADGQESPWYNRDRYCDSYSQLYRQHSMLIGDLDRFEENFDALDEAIERLKGMKDPDAIAVLNVAKEARAKVGAMVKTHLLAWGNSVRLVDSVKERGGTINYLKEKGYSIRQKRITPFLTKYFPDEFNKSDLNARWAAVEKECAQEAERMGEIKSLSSEAKAKLYAEITANSKKLMGKYEKWLKAAKAVPAKNPSKVSAGQYVTITSTSMCKGGFQKDDYDNALSNGGEFGHHWGFFENQDETGTWAITWTDEISKAYNAIEATVNPSRRDRGAMFRMSPADNTGKVASGKFEISIPRYELYNASNKAHRDARNRNYTYHSDEGELVRMSSREAVAHIEAEAVCRKSEDCVFLVFPEGNCMDGIDLSKYRSE